MSAYQHITRRRTQVPVRQLCHALRVAPSAYYAWQHRVQTPAPVPAWQVALRQAFARHGWRYGTRRLRAEVHAEGHAVGRGRIRRTRAAHGLRALRVRPSSPVPSCRARPIPTPPGGRRLTACSASRPPRPPTGSGWATLPVCLARAAAGSTWPRGPTDARARSSAETCASPCPKTS